MNDKIKEDLVKSMKEQDKFKTSVLRMLKSAIQTEKINKNKDLTDDEIILVIKKQIKIRTSSLEEYEKYNRLDLANDLKKEIDILSAYLPADLTDDELKIYKYSILLREQDKQIKDRICKTDKTYYPIKKSCYVKVALRFSLVDGFTKNVFSTISLFD